MIYFFTQMIITFQIALCELANYRILLLDIKSPVIFAKVEKTYYNKKQKRSY